MTTQYLPSPNKPPIDLLKLVGMIILCALAVFLFSRCSEVKKDQRAVNRVNANANLQNQVVNPWMQAHPQDTTPKITVDTPKTITVYNTQLVKDTTGRQRLIDSVKEANIKEIDCGKAATDAYDLGYEQAEKYYLDNPIKAKCPPDTTKLFYMTSQVRRWQDSSAQKDKEISYYKGKNDSLVEQASQNIKKIDKLWVIIILISLGAILSHILRSYIPTIKIPKL